MRRKYTVRARGDNHSTGMHVLGAVQSIRQDIAAAVGPHPVTPELGSRKREGALHGVDFQWSVEEMMSAQVQ